MDIFNIPQPPYKELLLIERELELLDKMWGLVAEWEATYKGWKDGLFRDLKVCRSSWLSGHGILVHSWTM
jgi:dynein heavy chain